MVALRSRRLETLLGAPLDDLQYHHLEALVTNHVGEAFDLDFKGTLYGNGEKERRDLATDVAALANTAGGLLILGIEEDRQARAAAAPGVAISDDEIRRILQIIGSLVVPLPVFDVVSVRTPGEPGHGFLVIAVLSDPLAPHAVIVNQGLRYPRRNGTTMRYLSEPEVASAYRERLAGAQRQVERAREIVGEATRRLDQSDMPWVIVSLVPDQAGELSINTKVVSTFKQEIVGQHVTVVPAMTGARFDHAGVGRRRLLAGGALDGTREKRVSVELHTDGSGVYSVAVPNLAEASQFGRPQWIEDERLVVAVMSGLLLLAQHARDRAAAGGSALIRAQIFPIDGHQIRLGQRRFDNFPDSLGDTVVTSEPPPAEAAAELDSLAQPGPALVAATALLVDDMAQAFGVPEMAQLTRDGQLRKRYWRWPQAIDWAKEHGIDVTDDAIS